MKHLPVSIVGIRSGSDLVLLDIGFQLEPSSIGRRDGVLLSDAKGITGSSLV